MPRPITKTELLDQSQSNYKRLMDFIEGMDPAEQQKEFPPATMNRNIADVLFHLHHWHLMMLKWYDEGMQGQKPAMPAPGYSWKNTPELNLWIWEKYKIEGLEAAKARFADSHQKVLAIIVEHSNEELFEKKRYKWTGSTSLGAYLISSTSSHYDWAYKLIKRAKK